VYLALFERARSVLTQKPCSASKPWPQRARMAPVVRTLHQKRDERRRGVDAIYGRPRAARRLAPASSDELRKRSLPSSGFRATPLQGLPSPRVQPRGLSLSRSGPQARAERLGVNGEDSFARTGPTRFGDPARRMHGLDVPEVERRQRADASQVLCDSPRASAAEWVCSRAARHGGVLDDR